MPLLNFGQPADGVMQMSYVVKDIHRAIQDWIRNLHVGPRFLLEDFTESARSSAARNPSQTWRSR